MRLIIYVDILIAVNLFTNYFILLATAKFLQIKASKIRVILGAMLGAMFSLYILFPEINIIFSFLAKLFISAAIIWVSFCSPKYPELYFKTILCFYSISFGFSGLMLAIWFLFRPNGMVMKNGVVYFNISPTVLIITTTISYFVIETMNKTIGKRQNKEDFCELEIKILGETFKINAKIDTGNNLKEPFSGLPVVVVREDIIKAIIPQSYLGIWWPTNKNFCSGALKHKVENKFRLIPFSSVSGEGTLPAFKPEYIILKHNKVRREGYVAICQNELLKDGIEGLIGTELLD